MYFVLVVQYFQTEPYPKTSTVQFIGWWITFRTVYCLDIIYNKPTSCNSGSTVPTNNYKHAVHVLDAPCVHQQDHYRL